MTTGSTTEQKKRPASDTGSSKYVQYLPGLYHEDHFMGRFLKIFENILTPIEEMIEYVHLYFDPRIAPEGLLPWLASWVDIVLDEAWPVEKRRQLIGAAVELYRWRGTRWGLTEYLRIYTGVEPVITEQIAGFRLGESSLLGWSTILGEGQDHCFTVTLELDDSSAVDLERVRAIIEAEKPAHAAYKLEVVKRASREAGPAEGENPAE